MHSDASAMSCNASLEAFSDEAALVLQLPAAFLPQNGDGGLSRPLLCYSVHFCL